MKNSFLPGYSITGLLLIAFTLFPNITFSQSNFQITIDKINYLYQKNSYIDGLFTVTYDPGSTGKYMSIGAYDGNTGKFKIIVSNLWLPGLDEVGSPYTLSTVFDLGYFSSSPVNRPSITSLPSILTCYIHLFNAVALYPFDPSTWFDTKEVQINQVTEDAKGAIIRQDNSIQITTASVPGYTVGDTRTNYRYRSDVPNFDLNDSEHGDTDTYAGDLNACVPTATSNSIAWMNMKYNDVKLPAGMTHRNLLEELSGLMKRERNEGTSDTNMVLGKLDFFEKYNLPVEVKYQAKFATGNIKSSSGKTIARDFGPPGNNPPTWDFLKKQIKDGEDVEMNFTWYDSTDNMWYAHSVCITGINEFASGVKKIAFKHDLYQGVEGGLKEEVHEVTVDNSGWMRFGTHNQNFIATVVAESPIIPFGRETAAWLNELFANSAPNTNSLEKTAVVNDFIEVALHVSVTDLNNYKISLYEGTNGAVYAEYTLDQFTVGSTTDSLTIYYYSFQPNDLHSAPAGVAISYTGSIIPGQFYSYGGSFTPVDGDATGLTSTDLGNPVSGSSFALTGTGTNYSQFTWEISNSPSPGQLNDGQAYSANLPSVPMLASPTNNSTMLPLNVTLVWNSVSSASNYNLQVATDSLFTTLVYDGAVKDTFKIFSNLTEGIKYYWKVKAVANNGMSVYSTVWNFTTMLFAPDHLLAVSKENNQVQLSWHDNSGNESGYQIERKLGDSLSTNNFALIFITPANATAYTDTSSLLGQTYYTYRVRAFNSESFSDYSSEKIVDKPVPVELVSFEAKALESKVILTWSTASETNNRGFIIERNLGNVWSTAAFVQGMFNSTSITDYKYIDDFSSNSYSGNIKYKLKQIDMDGSYTYSKDITINVDFTPKQFKLYQNYPNPFNPTTTISFDVAKQTHVKLIVYNVLGQQIRVLVDEIKAPGKYGAKFSVDNIPSGIYIYRIEMDNYTSTMKMILMK